MPQLKKVVLAIGSRLIYTDTYDEALAELGQSQPPLQQASAVAAGAPPPAAVPAAGGSTLAQQIREHLRRYRDLAAQGKWAEAGKELEAIEAAVKQ